VQARRLFPTCSVEEVFRITMAVRDHDRRTRNDHGNKTDPEAAAEPVLDDDDAR
jgi:hypothetical protein